MIRLIDLTTNKSIDLLHGSNILGRGLHDITDRHCSRRQAEVIVNYEVSPPTIHIIPLGMNPVRLVVYEDKTVIMTKDVPVKYEDGDVFALFGEYKYQVQFGNALARQGSNMKREPEIINLEEGNGQHMLNGEMRRGSGQWSNPPSGDMVENGRVKMEHQLSHHPSFYIHPPPRMPSSSHLPHAQHPNNYPPVSRNPSFYNSPVDPQAYPPFSHAHMNTAQYVQPDRLPANKRKQYSEHDPRPPSTFKSVKHENSIGSPRASTSKPKSLPPIVKPNCTHGKLIVIYHTKCLEHNVPEWHLETPDRLRSVIETINDLSRSYSDSLFHVVRNPNPPSPPPVIVPSLSSSQLVSPSPYLSFSPLPSLESSSSFIGSLASAQQPSFVMPPSANPTTSPTTNSTYPTTNPTTNPITNPTSPTNSTNPISPTNPAKHSNSTSQLPTFKLVTREAMEVCHDSAYLDTIKSKIPHGSQPLHATQYSQDEREPDQGDTFVSSGTWDAAVYAASVVCHAVDYIALGHYAHAFCAVRPPGHHAGISGRTLDACSQGYCILNNVAIGATYARSKYNFSKIAVVDFDVHHGNGTQEILGSKDGFLFVSIHVGDLYPHTGGSGEKINVTNHGRVVNVSLHPDSVPKVFKKYFEDTVIPKLEEYEPQLIFLSSGFDGHKADPTEGGMRLTKTEYRYITELLKEVALRYCGGKLISVLEGGYHLPSLKKCVEEHLTVLVDDD